MARRLAAIVAVDIVGFSRLMAVDEDETWQALKELRALIDPILETEGGRIVKSTGDGVLVEAPSVIGAVRAAIDVQRRVDAWNRHRPADRALRLRIGINLGDVIVAEDGDVYGDGVNVAARLEGLAPAGGISLSDSAYQQVRGRVDAPFVDRGEQHVKNIPDPVRVWEITSPSDQPAPAGVRVFASDGDPTASRRTAALAAGAGIAALAIGGAAYGIFANAGVTPENTTTTEAATTQTTVDSPLSAAAADIIWVADFDADVVDVAGNTPDRCQPSAPCPPVAAVLLGDGTIRGVDFRTGSETWEAAFDLGLDTPVTDPIPFRRSADLEVLGDRIYVVKSDSRFVYSIDLEDGSQEWRRLAPFDSALGGPNLAPAGPDTYVGFGLGVARLDDRGFTEWAHRSATTLLVTDISADGSVVAAIDGRSLYRFDPETGERLWELGPPVVASPVWILAQEREIASGTGRSFDRRILLATERGQLMVVDAETRAVRWSIDITLPPGSVPDERAFVVGVDGEAIAVWMDTGEEDWIHTDVRIDRPLIGSGDRVHGVAGSDLITFNARSGTELRRIELPGRPTTDPVIVGDFVLVGIGTSVAAIPADG